MTRIINPTYQRGVLVLCKTAEERETAAKVLSNMYELPILPATFNRDTFAKYPNIKAEAGGRIALVSGHGTNPYFGLPVIEFWQTAQFVAEFYDIPRRTVYVISEIGQTPKICYDIIVATGIARDLGDAGKPYLFQTFKTSVSNGEMYKKVEDLAAQFGWLGKWED